MLSAIISRGDKLYDTISLVIGKRFLSNPVTTSTMESCSLGKRRSSLQTKKDSIHSVNLNVMCLFQEEMIWANLCAKRGAVLDDPL